MLRINSVLVLVLVLVLACQVLVLVLVLPLVLVLACWVRDTRLVPSVCIIAVSQCMHRILWEEHYLYISPVNIDHVVQPSRQTRYLYIHLISPSGSKKKQ